MVTCGCGGSPAEAPPARAAVMGTVTLDGDLLHQGVIRFVPTNGTHGPQATAVIDDGVFILPVEFGPVVGTNRIEIESTDTGGLAMDDEQALERLQSAAKRPQIEVVRVPAAYNRDSKLIADVPPSGTSGLNFELVSSK